MYDYRVMEIPLNAVVEKVELVPRGQPISSVGIVRLPAAASDAVDIHFSSNGDPIPVIAALQSLSRSPALADGIFYSVRAAVGGAPVKVLVGLGVTLEGENAEVLNAILETLQRIETLLRGGQPL